MRERMPLRPRRSMSRGLSSMLVVLANWPPGAHASAQITLYKTVSIGRGKFIRTLALRLVICRLARGDGWSDSTLTKLLKQLASNML